jgi:preprotein translocase subunit SecE
VDLSLLIAAALTLAVVVALLIWREPVLAWTQRSTVFIREVRAEVRKITWPGWDDLRRSTLVITIIVIVIGIVIGLMDWLFSMILIDFFGRAFG